MESRIPVLYVNKFNLLSFSFFYLRILKFINGVFMRVIIKVVLLSLFLITKCYAECTTTVTLTKTLQFNAITIQHDATVGTVLGTVSIPRDSTVLGPCSGSGNTTMSIQMMYFGAVSSGTAGVFKTNVSGVGISGYYYSATYPFASPATTWTFGAGTGVNIGDSVTVFKLIKIGDITSGTLSPGLVGKVFYSGNPTVDTVDVMMGTSSVTQLACSINTPTLTFPIGNILKSQFGSSVGFIPSGAQNMQNLGLNCDAGANINVSLSGTQNPDVGTTSVLALTGQGGANVAKGVGVQLLYNSSPLVLNNNIVLKTSSGGQETFPLTARYYQTKTTVATGTANASATLNITYQ